MANVQKIGGGGGRGGRGGGGQREGANSQQAPDVVLTSM